MVFNFLRWNPQGTLYLDADLAHRNTFHQVEQALEIDRQFRPDGFGVEVNQFQELLADELWRQSRERNLALPMFAINNQVNKQVRIRRLTPYLAKGCLRFKGDSRGARLLVEQMRDFPLADHDDGLDALGMAVRLAADLLSGAPLDDEIELTQIVVA